MTYAVVFSRKDDASLTLYKVFKEFYNRLSPPYNVIFYESGIEPIYTDNIDRSLSRDTELIIFLSRHVAKSSIPTITCHAPGNPDNFNKYGGLPKSLPPTNPCFIGYFLRAAENNVKKSGLDYTVSLEVTHHGPTELEKPSVFVEIGPTKTQWRDAEGAFVVAKSILEALDKLESGLKCVGAVGFGGPHYAPIFTAMTLEEGYNFGHIISKHILQECYTDIIDLAISKTLYANYAVINWKGLKGGVRQCVSNYLSSKKLKIIKK